MDVKNYWAPKVVGVLELPNKGCVEGILQHMVGYNGMKQKANEVYQIFIHDWWSINVYNDFLGVEKIGKFFFYYFKLK